MPQHINDRAEPPLPARHPIRRGRVYAHDREAFARVSSQELTQLLQLDGATIVSFRDYGTHLQARRHLIFVRHAVVVEIEDLLDILQAAGIGPGRFDRLLSAVRLEPTRAL
jgi:hypothetical protein